MGKNTDRLGSYGLLSLGSAGMMYTIDGLSHNPYLAIIISLLSCSFVICLNEKVLRTPYKKS